MQTDLLFPWQHWSKSGRGVFILSAYFLSSFVLSKISLGPEFAIAIIFPAAALDVMLPFVFGLPYILALLANPFIGAFFSALLGFDTLPVFSFSLFGYALAKTLAYGGAALILRRVLQIRVNLASLRDISWFLFIASFTAPFVASLLSTSWFAIRGLLSWDTWWLDFLRFWAGDATGVAMFAPLLLSMMVFSDPNVPEAAPAASRPYSRLIFSIMLLLLLFCAWLVYGQPNVTRLDYTYIIFIPLLWIAVRSGFKRTALAVCLLNMGVVLAIAYQLSDPEVVALQLNLMTASYVSLLLAAVFSEYHRSRQKLRHLAFHDTLTQLPNRAKFIETLNGFSQEETPHTVLMIDLDRFKTINDTFGHTVGDAFLEHIAKQLKACLSVDDLLARLGGDEFGVLLAGVSERKKAIEVAERLEKVLHQPSQVGNYQINVQASIGIAVAEQGMSDLLQKADTAMHEAKLLDKAGHALFDEGMRERFNTRLGLEQDLQQALARQEIMVYYQPIMSLKDKKLIGMEALMRWNHSKEGLISPETFIPIAEETGLIVDLSNWLMSRAFQDWAAQERLYVTINLSLKQLKDRQFLSRLQSFLKTTGFPIDRLVLEVTERMVMMNLEDNVALLRRLADAGIRIALDDFGTGYASLNYLKRLPIHILKVDRTFLSGIPNDQRDMTLVQTIIAMGQKLGLSIVAEGVEAKEQETFLLEQGCHEVQGYFYGRPLPLDAFRKLMIQQRSA